MNERVSLQDLIDLLAKKQEITKKDAEAFLRELFAVVSENIESGESVKIKDFGTFKLVKVNARKSVDVNTGEAIEIAAHYKLSFNPDKSLKEAVNRPFAHFESVVLEDGVNFDNIENEIAIEEEDVEEDATVEEDITEYIAIEPVVEEKPEPPEVVESPLADVITEPEEIFVADTEIIETPKEKTVEETIEEFVSVTPAQETTVEAVTEAEEKAFEPAQGVDDISDKITDDAEETAIQPLFEDPFYPDDDKEESESESEEKPKRRGIRKRYISLAFFVFLIVAGFVLGGLYFEKIAKFLTEGSLNEGKKTAIVDKPETKADNNIAIADTLAQKTDSVKVQQPDKIAETIAATNMPLATEIIREGHTLRNIALKHYGNKSFWIYIYEENKDKIKNPNSVPLGTKLIIPSPSKYGIDAQNSDSVKKAKEIEKELFKQMGISN